MAQKTGTAPDSLGLTDRESAKLAGVSRAHWRKLYAADQTPRPIRLGRSVRWLRDELVAWMRAGCPPYDKWAVIWKEAK